MHWRLRSVAELRLRAGFWLQPAGHALPKHDLRRPAENFRHQWAALSLDSQLRRVAGRFSDPRYAAHACPPTTQQLSCRLETTTNFAPSCHITSVITDAGTGGPHMTTSTSYDGFGRPTDLVDPRGIDTNTAYDALDRA